MTGKEIKFSYKDNTYIFKEGKKRNLKGNTLKNGYKNSMKDLKIIFDAITDLDKEKKLSPAEMKLLADLSSVFAKTGSNDAVSAFVDAIRSELIGDEFLVDYQSEELQNVIKEFILTKEPGVLRKLLKLDVTDSYNSVCWKSKVALETAANIFKAIKDKEYSGDALSDKELQLKEILKKGVVNGFQYEFDNIDADGDNCSDLRLNMDGHGNICYLGEIGENFNYVAVAGKKRENVENYTKDLRTARAKKADGTDKTETELKAEYKALYKKYADTKDDDSFACSVLSKASEMNADKEDILKAINNNGVEFLTYLYYSHLKDDEKAEVQKAVVDRITKLYTEEQKGEVKNMVFLGSAFNEIDDITFDNDTAKNDAAKKALKQQIIESYFDKKEIPATEEGGEPTYKYTYTGRRRMTAEEARAFVEATKKAVGSGDNDYTKAVIETLTLDDLGKGRLGYELEICDTDALKESFIELANYITEPDDMVRLIKNIRLSSNIPFDKLIEYFNPEQNLFLIAPLLSRFYGAESISNENRNKLIDLITRTNTGIQDVISSGVTYTNLAKLLPYEMANEGDNPEVKWTEQAKKVFNAVLANGTISDLEILYCKAKQSTDLRAKIIDKVKEQLKTNSTNPEFIMDVAYYFDFDDSVKQAILDIDASKLEGDKKDVCMENVFYLCFPEWEFGDETRYKIENSILNKAIKNNWLTKTTVKVGDSSKEYYRYDTKGAMLAEKWNSTNTDGTNADNFKLVPYKDVLTYHNNEDGEIKAEKILEDLDDLAGYDNLTDYLKEDNEHITKYNVVALIKKFSELSPKEGIIEYMDNEWGGPSVAQMERIPKALVEAAEAKGLEASESPLKELVEFMKDPKRVESEDDATKNDYESGKAKELDELMKAVIDKLSK